MKKKNGAVKILGAIAVAVLFATAFASPAQAIQYTGSLNWAGGGIFATNPWDDSATELSWVVKDTGVLSGGFILWQYDYKFTVPEKDISHVIIEVTDPVGLDDFSQGKLDMYSSANGNPGMPGPMEGLKFEPTDLTTYSFSFTTTHSPVWGDFYAKDGKEDGIDVIAYNTGFSAVDPVVAPHDGSELNHLLRPDGPQTGTPPPVPEPTTMLLLGLGLIGLAGVGRKFKK